MPLVDGACLLPSDVWHRVVSAHNSTIVLAPLCDLQHVHILVLVSKRQLCCDVMLVILECMYMPHVAMHCMAVTIRAHLLT